MVKYDCGAKVTTLEFCLPCVLGGSPLYKPYRCVQPQSVAVLRRFSPKTGIDFAYFGLESGMVFEGTTRSHHYHFCSKLTKKERKICKFEMDFNFEKSFSLLF